MPLSQPMTGVFLSSPLGMGPTPPKLAGWTGDGDGRHSVSGTTEPDPFATMNTKMWTESDDLTLKVLHDKHGDDWGAISTSLCDGKKTKQQCKARYLMLKGPPPPGPARPCVAPIL